jgi:hypothetical protein
VGFTWKCDESEAKQTKAHLAKSTPAVLAHNDLHRLASTSSPAISKSDSAINFTGTGTGSEWRWMQLLRLGLKGRWCLPAQTTLNSDL